MISNRARNFKSAERFALQAKLLDMVCYDVQVEPELQPITGEELARGTNQAPDACLDVHFRGFWERQRAAFFDIRVCHPNADSYRDLSPKQIYRIHENEKKRKYNSRVTEIEQDTFTPLVFTTTGGMGDECLRYHSRLAELLSAKSKRTAPKQFHGSGRKCPLQFCGARSYA